MPFTIIQPLTASAHKLGDRNHYKRRGRGRNRLHTIAGMEQARRGMAANPYEAHRTDFITRSLDCGK
jgi:hypothetical protein